MDSSDFHKLNAKDLQTIRSYLDYEFYLEFLEEFFEDNREHRRNAAMRIASLSEGTVLDAYVPYVAMTYFDLYAQREEITVGPMTLISSKEEVWFIATCCFILSARARTDEFNLHEFMNEKKLTYNLIEIMQREDTIERLLVIPAKRGLTPFHFLDFYYSTLEGIGGFKRRSISEIIVQSQGECYFRQFKPSEIAMSAFLAATYIVYPSEFDKVAKSVDQSGKLAGCVKGLVRLCHKLKIKILLAAEPATQSEEAAAAEMIFKSDVTDVTEKIAPKALMNFELHWPTSQEKDIVRYLTVRELGGPKVLPKPKLKVPETNYKFTQHFMSIFNASRGQRGWGIHAGCDEARTLFRRIGLILPEAISVTQRRGNYFRFELKSDMRWEDFEVLLLDKLRGFYYDGLPDVSGNLDPLQ